MKTITVTHQNKINYGAVLQAYALQKQLHKLCIDDEVLDLKKKPQIFTKFKFDKHLPGNLYGTICKLLCVLQTKRRIKRFNEFVENNIKTTRHYRTIEEVVKNPPIADVYITGSDQTFNTYWGIQPDKFLRFGNKDTKRISYAASMGKPAVKDEYLDDFVSAIKAYNFLSVREQCSADYISKVCNMPCSTNLDPVLLLSREEWSELASSYRLSQIIGREKYILVYYLLENSLLNNVVKKIKKETGLKVIVLTPNVICRVKNDMIIRDAGPLEFLNLFENAAYILTTTFHGVCFAVTFQKTFFTFISHRDEIRINGLLSALNLSGRIVTDIKNIALDEMRYDTVNAIINSERKRAKEYLIRALGI